MTITINGLSKRTFNDLISRLDLDLAYEHISTRRETVNTSGNIRSDLYAISITDPYDISLKFMDQTVSISRFGVIPAYNLDFADYDNIIIV